MSNKDLPFAGNGGINMQEIACTMDVFSVSLFSMTFVNYNNIRRRIHKLYELSSDLFVYTIYNKICSNQYATGKPFRLGR